MPLFQARKVGPRRQMVQVTAPKNSVVFAVRVKLVETCPDVWVRIPAGFCLVDVAVGTGMMPLLTHQTWKTGIEQAKRAELFCVAQSLVSEDGREHVRLRIPCSVELDGRPHTVGVEYDFDVEIGLPLALCQTCRDRDILPFDCGGDPHRPSVEAMLLDAVQRITHGWIGSGEPSAWFADARCQGALDELTRVLYTMGLTVKNGCVRPYTVPNGETKR